MTNNLNAFLNECVNKFNNLSFIENDPIKIPHSYTKKQDIEISAFWTAMLAWGQRKTIIKNAQRLFEQMDNAPHDFIINHIESDRKRFLDFKHRTFQPTDTLYFLTFLQEYYKKQDSLEAAFSRHITDDDRHIEKALVGFHHEFFSLPDAPSRTRKHIATPASKSTCKRLCMFLRWMVRKDLNGVDFGLWESIKPAQLMMPLDVHVDRYARQLGLLTRPQTDWLSVIELTDNLRQFDPQDPVKYDYALFGLGVLQHDFLK